jgi:DNA-binding MarR family transcriptional regulator
MPDSLTHLLDVPPPLLAERVSSGDLVLSLDELDAVVTELALRIEAGGTREDILAAAEAFHDLAEWAADRIGGGDGAARRAMNRWSLLAEHLTERATRSDAVGAAALLGSDLGKPRRLLEILADSPAGSQPRSLLRERLELSESHVSHILRGLHDAGLVHRHKAGKTVTVTISARGRGLVRTVPVEERSGLAAGDALLSGLPPERRRRIEDGPTLAPVLDFPIGA